MYCYLKCIMYGKLLKPRQSFWITLYNDSQPKKYLQANFLQAVGVNITVLYTEGDAQISTAKCMSFI